MESHTVSLIIIAIGILMSGYFSASETAFSSLNRIRIKTMADKGDKRAALVSELSDDFNSLLSTILIGNNIVNIASTSVATVLFVNLLGEGVGPTVSTVVITIVVLIFGEVTPKSLAKESPEKFAMFSAPILRVIMVVFSPLNKLFEKWKQIISKIIKPADDSGITEEELLSIVEEAKEDGGIDEQENELIKSALDLTDRVAADVLTPRVDIVAVSTEATKEEIAGVFAESGYSRLPVYDGSIDNIIGIIYHKDFYTYVHDSSSDIADITRPILPIHKNKKLGVLLKELQSKKIHIAIVLDEYGGTVGLVTLEDILEELVGEIWDEHDEISSEIEKKSDTEYIVSGNASVERVFEALGLDEGEGLSSGIVNGWIMDELGRIPVEGDSFDYDGYRITVIEMSDHRIGKILFKLIRQGRSGRPNS